MQLPLAAERLIFQVSDLNARLHELFDAEFRNIWVAGEISGCRLAASGHYYFCLKDDRSQIKCALFKSAARFARFKPQDGLAVIARGDLEIYEARGEYQLIVELLEPRGMGALQLAFEQLKKKLAGEGLFDQARKRPLPGMPVRIGLVTSPSGAVICDILQVLDRRFQGLHIRLFPAQVQGEGSVEQICQGIRHFSESGWAQVVIVARGGGSLEDLWSFNDERVARSISDCRTPVISAVGHETDFTIADFVADCRAPAPSAAAEIVICTRESLLERIEAARAKAVQTLRYRLLVCGRDLYQRGIARAATLVQRTLARRAQRVDDLEYQMRSLERRLLDVRGRQFAGIVRRLQAADLRLRLAGGGHRRELAYQELKKIMLARLWQARRRQEGLQAHLTQLSPLAVLGRGYAIVEDARKHVLRSSAEISQGDEVRIRLLLGEIDAVISRTRES